MDKRLICLITSISFISTSIAAIPSDTITTATDSTSQGISLGDVVVYGARSNFGVTSSQMSAVAVSNAKIQAVPVFLGEPDVLKSLQKFPGVQSANDGSAGIFVRGGDYDQNYITLDGSALYHAEHLKGYVSAINPDVVQNINFYRGAFPARYGSRLSSVIDVGIKDGDFSRYHGLLSVGMLSSRAQIEGPLWRNHTSLSLAARLSYFDFIAKPVLKHFYDVVEALGPYENMKYYDFNAKLVHRFSPTQRLSVVAYYGRDKDDNKPSYSSLKLNTIDDPRFPFEKQTFKKENRSSSTTNDWWNLVTSIYWTAHFTDKLKVNTNLSYSKYSYRLGHESFYNSKVDDHYREYYYHFDVSSTTYKSEVSDLALAVDADYKLNRRHYFRGGFRLSYQKLTPTNDIYRINYTKRYNGDINKIPEVKPKPEFIITTDTTDYTTSGGLGIKNAALYLEDDFDVLSKLKINLGLRGSAYFVTGKSSIALEPRVAIRYLVNDNAAIKLSYSRMTQGIHRLVSDNLVAASDIWVPITNEIPLMTSNIYGIAFNYNLPLDINLAVEGYYKTMNNVLEYRNGASYTQAEMRWNDLVAVGKGRAYGVEFLLEKNFGSLTGWISYTWSKSLRKFDRSGQEINNAQEFYAGTDRRHNFNAIVMKKIPLSRTCRFDLSASWTYQSGRRGTIPLTYIFGYDINAYAGDVQVVGHEHTDYFAPTYERVLETFFYSVTGAPMPTYTYKTRNSYKLPCIHHLDFTVSFAVNHKLGETSLGLSVYNIYNRMNVSNVYLGYEKNELVLKGICPFPIMPSMIITHKF